MKTRRRKRDDRERGSARDMKGSTLHCFDYEKMARKAHIPPEKLEELSRLIRQEFPRDEMMYLPLPYGQPPLPYGRGSDGCGSDSPLTFMAPSLAVGALTGSSLVTCHSSLLFAN